MSRGKGVWSWVVLLVLLPGLARAGAPVPPELSPEGRRSTQRALDWLVQAQRPDGAWGLEPGSEPDLGTSCVALLALMASGSTPSRGKYAREITKGVRWVLDECERHQFQVPNPPASLITSKLGSEIHGFFTTMLLAELLGMEGSLRCGRVKKALLVMVPIIAGQQKPDGSWNNPSFAPLLATASAWMAIRAAYMGGQPAGSAAAVKTLQYVESQLDARTGIFKGSWQGREAGYRFFGQAAALRVLYGMGRGESPAAQQGVKALFEHGYKPYEHPFVTEGENYMAAYYATAALMQDPTPGRTVWKAWFARIQKTLVECQNPDGSWRGTACITSRVFCTAASLLTLQVPLRKLALNEY